MTNYEYSFLRYYLSVYNAKFFKVKNNTISSLPTDVIFYSESKRPLKHRVVYEGVTLEKMFSALEPNKLYSIKKILEGSDNYR